MAKTTEELCAERRQRVLDAVALKVPDRVPIYLPFYMFAAKYVGMTFQEAFENPDKLLEANEKAHLDFKPDLRFLLVRDTASVQMLGVRSWKWPGYGAGPNSSEQWVEGEYMKAEEYDAFLNDPSDFAMRVFLPRVYDALEGFGRLPPLMSLMLAFFNLPAVFSQKAVIESLEALVRAAKQSMRLPPLLGASSQRLNDLGFPGFIGGMASAPFDVISDFLRGLKGSTMDMFRCPDKLMAAQQKLLPIILGGAINAPRPAGHTFIAMMLHRGSDEFMSLKQFEKFYWPGLRTVILALIDAGLTPFVFWEGIWDNRLQYLRELPRGKIFGMFDRTDLFKAKEVLRDRMCICGGMPLSLLSIGTPEQVKAHTRRLIDVVGKEGGFIMGPNELLDNAKPELVRVWVDTTREYGVYR
jgi:uroporphyrinogen-III decarboxylase